MTFRAPYTVTNSTISFFAKGRMYSVSSGDPVAYQSLRAALMTPEDVDHDIDELLAIVDVRYGLVRQSQGEITLIDEQIVFRGQPLHNVWVDKILAYRAAGEPYTPIWNALSKLVHNPTPQAIERLPIFLERTALGFLPDGKFLCFKGVKSDFYSAHVGADGTKFRHLVGDVCRMERKDVDPDPNQTCSTGLHVGAPGYVKQNYGGASYALVLVAVDPVDVVCVPVDYQGEKMRVCGYEVIAHLDQAYNDELLGSLRTTQSHGYGAPVPPAAPAPVATVRTFESGSASELVALAQVGDVVDYAGCLSVDEGTYTVNEIDPDLDDDARLSVTIAGGHQSYISNQFVTKLTRNGVVIGLVEADEEDEPEEDDFAWADGIAVGDVVKYSEFGLDRFTLVHDLDDLLDINTADKVEPSDLMGSMVAKIGDIVTIAGHEVLRDGDYVVDDVDDDEDQGDGDGYYFLVKVAGFTDPTPIANGHIQAVKRDTGLIWPVGSNTIEAGDTVTIVGEGWPPAGVYPVDDTRDGLILSTEHDGNVRLDNIDRMVAHNRNIK